MKKPAWSKFNRIFWLILPFILSSCGIFGSGSTATPTSTETSLPTVTLTHTVTATNTPTLTFTPTFTITPHVITGPTTDPSSSCVPSGEITCRDITVPIGGGIVCTTSICTDSCNNVVSTTNKGCQ